MKRSYLLIALILLTFATISFVTNIIDPMGADVQASFGLSNEQLGYLATSLFVAYALMSIPSGLLVERLAPKPVLLAAFALSCLGTALYALKPSYAIALPALFLIGVGFAVLQVIINPLLREAGGEEHYAFFANLSQMIFALGSAASPHLYRYLVSHLKDQDSTMPHNVFISALSSVTKAGLPWVSLYWVFTLLLLAMIGVVLLVKLPAVQLKEDDRIGSLRVVWALFQRGTAKSLTTLGMQTHTPHVNGHWMYPPLGLHSTRVHARPPDRRRAVRSKSGASPAR